MSNFVMTGVFTSSVAIGLVILPVLLSTLPAPCKVFERTLPACNGHHYTNLMRGDSNVQLRIKRPDQKDTKVSLCIPAAFTNAYNGLQGLVIVDGKVVNGSIDSQLGGGLVLIDGDFDIFPTDNGRVLTEKFQAQLQKKRGSLIQQFQLVKDGVAESFRDKSVFQRRAVVVFRNGSKSVIESKEALTLSQFAKDLADLDVLNALYTDMGEWDEGWYRDTDGKLHVIGNLRSATNRQTNWLVFADASTGKPVSYEAASDWLRRSWTPPPIAPGEPDTLRWHRAILYGKFPLPVMSGDHDLVPLFRGLYKEGETDVCVSKIAIGLVDGTPGAVTYTYWSTGGSGTWEVLTLYRIKKGRIQPVGQYDLEDRAEVHRLEISGNSILLDWNKHGPEDGASNPSVHEVIRLHSKNFSRLKLE